MPATGTAPWREQTGTIMNNGEHIYMDHGASTPVREEVVTAMLPFWTDRYGNPAAVHRFGQDAARIISAEGAHDANGSDSRNRRRASEISTS